MSDENPIQSVIDKINEFLACYRHNKPMASCLLGEALALLSVVKQQMVCPVCKGKKQIIQDLDKLPPGYASCPACDGRGTLLAAYKIAQEQIANLQAEIERLKEPNGTAKGEFMHESIEKDAVQYDLPEEEIIQALCQDNKLLKQQIADLQAENERLTRVLNDAIDIMCRCADCWPKYKNTVEPIEQAALAAAEKAKEIK